MFCCLNVPPAYTPIETNDKINSAKNNDGPITRNNGNAGTSDFPGLCRHKSDPPSSGSIRLSKTGGNALVQYDPETMKDLIEVTVPSGMYPLQLIQVQAPDGRMVHATIPSGSKAGSRFLVKMPPIQNHVLVTGEPVVGDMNDLLLKKDTEAFETDGAKGETRWTHLSGTMNPQPPVVQSQNAPILKPPAEGEQLRMVSMSNQKSLIVTVPPGVAPGSTMLIRIPGEMNPVAVTVPPGGVSQFHMTYTPGNVSSANEKLCNQNQGATADSNNNGKSNKQNWNNNPVAVAPMLVGPMIV